ncbi:MAG: hypothetical protein NTW38_12860 [Candidatus Aminicenantes bacterium]|nr:hypothetical protein [Candidatus Aminicenantes bacterium]
MKKSPFSLLVLLIYLPSMAVGEKNWQFSFDVALTTHFGLERSPGLGLGLGLQNTLFKNFFVEGMVSFHPDLYGGMHDTLEMGLGFGNKFPVKKKVKLFFSLGAEYLRSRWTKTLGVSGGAGIEWFFEKSSGLRTGMTLEINGGEKTYLKYFAGLFIRF